MNVRSLAPKLLRALLGRFSPYNQQVYEACRHYVDRHRGENDDNLQTNGELRFMTEVLPRCKVVFDVGANTGDWAALALTANPAIALHCFEPSGATFARLLARRFAPGVICNNFGLGAKAEERTLHIFSEASGMNSLYPRHGLEAGWNLAAQTQRESVQLQTLDGYRAERNIGRIDFLKLDVEGHEFEVFKGAAQTLAAGEIDIIQFEYGGCNIDARVLLKDIFEFFRPFRYSFHKIYPDRLQPVSRYDQRLENFQYQNWAVIRD